jgi:type II secretory pathway pseudopilin PulG
MSAGVVVLIVLGALLALVVLGLLAGGAERRERAADLVAEFWDWLRLGR